MISWPRPRIKQGLVLLGNCSMASIMTEQSLNYYTSIQKKHKQLGLDSLKLRVLLGNAKVLMTREDDYETKLKKARNRLRPFLYRKLADSVVKEIHTYMMQCFRYEFVEE